ncbi:MAG TPA: DUF4115 domain-containing protein [Candidatus Latescibacteria bacterium]|nr:DUF4115 domain-containing protein [Candidatus Latescibacterota bacterium]
MSDDTVETSDTSEARISLADRFRRSREERGLSLQDVADRSRISVTILQHYESGDFSVVEPAFVRGHLRTYARIVGVEEREIDSVFPPSGLSVSGLTALEDDEAQEALFIEKRPALPAIPWKTAAWFGLGAALLVALWLWHPWHSPENSFAESPPEVESAVAPAQKENAEITAPAENDTLSDEPAVRLATPPELAKARVPGVVRTMTIEATDSVWVLIARKDGMVLFDGILVPGQSKQSDVEDTLRVTLGRYWAARLLLNRQAVPTPRQEARNMTFFLCTPSGIVPP